MATRLTTTAIGTRKLIKIAIIALIVILVGRVALNFAFSAIRSALPKREAAPTLGFGALPTIGFPEQTNELPVLEFTIETPTGTIPTFPNKMSVYALEQQYSDLFSYDQMIQRAQVFSFTAKPRQDVFSERKYIFEHTNTPSTFEYDLVTETFSISYNLASDSTPLLLRSRTPEGAKEALRDRLDAAELLSDELAEGPSDHIFLKVEGQNLVRALALADAQLVQINLFRRNLQSTEEFPGYPAVTADPNKANVWFIVSGSDERSKVIIAGEYKYFPVDESLFETYPIKTGEQALRDLVDGKGYVANLGFNVDGNVTITNIYLAYYDPNIPESFMQPVIVFEGRDNFVAYVAAVTDEYIATPEQQ